MRSSEGADSDDPAVAVYYDGAFADHRAGLRAAFERLGDVEVTGYRPLGEAGERSGDADEFPVVFAASGTHDAAVGSPAVWVTPDADLAAAALSDGAVDAINWRPGDDPAWLATKLRHLLVAAGETGGIDRTDVADASGVEHAPRRALERIDDGVIALDEEDRITYCNDAATDLFGVPREALPGTTVREHLDVGEAAKLGEGLARARETGEAATVELPVADGDRWFAVTAYPSADGVALYSREITERKKRESEQALYEYLVETVGDAVYLLDDAGRFTFVNDALCEMTGYDREELLGSSVHLIKDDETVAEAEDALRELLRDRRDGAAETPIAKLDVELVTRDGDHVPCTDRMTLRPMTDGEFAGTVGTLRDVSRQRRREDILSGLVEAAQEMVAAETTAEVADVVVATAARTLDVELAVVREYDPGTDRLHAVASSEAVETILGERPAYDRGEGPVGTAFAENRLVVEDDLEHLADHETGDEVAVGAYLPIGETRTLSVGHDTGEAFTDDELRFVELLATTAATVFDRVERDQERRRYEAVVEAAEDMLFTVDDEGRFTLVTESFASVLGRDRESLAGAALADVLADEEIAAAIASQRETTTYETDLVDADGRRLPSRITAAPIDEAGGDGVVATVRDISELRSAQREATQQRRRFTGLFETLADPVADVAYVDGTATIRSANPAFARLCEVDEHELRDAPLPRVQSLLPAGIAAALDPIADPGTAIETDVTARAGAGVSHYLLKTVPYEGDDRPRAFLILTDVTDVKERELHLQVLHRLLRHNLRNKTTVIQGSAEEIARRTEEERVASMAERIDETSRALVEASDTARTIQRVLESEETGESRPVADVAERLRTQFEGRFGDADADLSVSADLEGTVTFSEQLLGAVTELVENGIEHGEGDDPPTVEVTLEAGPDPGTVRISVADDGPGIPEDEWGIVTGDREITQLQHTSGLGLWLVKWVTDRHGGVLHLVSADETGTTVAIDLPA